MSSTIRISSARALQKIVEKIKNNEIKNVIIMSGAGISVNSGIPDFRSPNTGLYSKLREQYDLPCPEAMFELDYFRENPKPFYRLAKELYPIGKYRPTVAHHFINVLAEKNVLLRNYTQNIDGLELISGLKPDKLVQAHGGFETAHCIKCHKEYSEPTVRDAVFSNRVLKCSSCGGFVKPDIVFFGETLPQRYVVFSKNDFAKCDCLIITGTSLTVQPFASLINKVNSNVPRIVINNELPGKQDIQNVFSLSATNNSDTSDSPPRDVFMKCDCDVGFTYLAKMLGEEWSNTLTQYVINDREKLKQKDDLGFVLE